MQQREQKRIEDEIKALRRLPGNKKCADCKSLSNPYICVDFNTFVCTRCSGIHRDLGHRVKSVTAEIFSREEVAALRRGGNLKHNSSYLATWKEADFPEPNAEDSKRINKWFEEKYIRRRWYRDPTAVVPMAPQQQQVQQQVQPQQPQQPQQQFIAQTQQAPMATNVQGGWGTSTNNSNQGWGTTTVQATPQNQQYNQFQGMTSGAPAATTTMSSGVTVSASFNTGGWGSTGVTSNPQMSMATTTTAPRPMGQSAPQNVFVTNPLQNQQQQQQQQQQRPQQSNQDMLSLLMGSAPSTQTAPMNNNTNNNSMGMGMGMGMNTGFGGFGMTTTTSAPAPTQPNTMGSMYGSSSIPQTTTMNPNRAQPLVRGQQNNPFADLVDMAPSVAQTSTMAAAPATTTTPPMAMGAGFSQAANPMGSMFSSAATAPQRPPAQPTTMSLIDF